MTSFNVWLGAYSLFCWCKGRDSDGLKASKSYRDRLHESEHDALANGNSVESGYSDVQDEEEEPICEARADKIAYRALYKYATRLTYFRRIRTVRRNHVCREGNR